MKNILVLIIIILFFVVLLYPKLENNNPNQSQITPAPTNSNTESHSAVKSATSTSENIQNNSCTAIHVNPSDPQAYLPDPSCTPGETNSNVNQSNIFSTICKKGYSATIRPPVSYTEPLKLEQIKEYGYDDTNPRDYEEDHFISLELGGSPTDPKNLWPEPHPSFNEKDKVEDYLHKEVCNGNLTLTQAQQEITHNWYTIYQQLQ